MPRHVIRVAIATWLVENPSLVSGGDRDSEGPFQQRPSQGWGPTSESDRKDARQFYQHAVPLYRRGYRGGRLAQSVQRSAFPGRYAPMLGQAGRIVSKFEGGGAAPKPGAPGGGRAGIADLAQDLTRQVKHFVPPPPALQRLDSEAVMPRSAMPERATARAVLPGEQGRSQMQLPADERGTPFQGRTETRTERLPGYTAGEVKRLQELRRKQQGLERPVQGGVPRMGGDRRAVGRIEASRRCTHPWVPGQGGLRETQYAEHRIGRISDHWTGNRDAYAFDIGATGRQGTRIAKQIARRLGVGYRGGYWLQRRAR